jgi:hypothetical protein
MKCDGRIETSESDMAPCHRPATWVLQNPLGDHHYCSFHKARKTLKARQQGYALNFERITPSQGGSRD